MNNADTHIKVTGTAVTKGVEAVATGTGFLASLAAYQGVLNLIAAALGAILTSVLIWYWIRKGNIADREILLKEQQLENERNRLDAIANSYVSFLGESSPHRRKSDNMTKEQIIELILENEQLLNVIKSKNEQLESD